MIYARRACGLVKQPATLKYPGFFFSRPAIPKSRKKLVISISTEKIIPNQIYWYLYNNLKFNVFYDNNIIYMPNQNVHAALLSSQTRIV
jgi:hypothetical protein